MIPLFIGLTAFNLLSLSVAILFAYIWSGTEQAYLHQLAGVLATIACCAVHCIVFTYFIATAKWIQHAVAVKRLDPQLMAPTRSFRMQAFPAAMTAMGAVLLAAFSGAAADNRYLDGTWHHVLAWVALGVNAGMAVLEYRAISRNGALIDRILETIALRDAQVAR
jgi:hypothetical protein